MTDTCGNPLVSVIVPVYKTEDTVAACLESITAQTEKNIEIIVVDDGSPDRTCEIVETYIEQDLRIILIHQPNGGLGAARNAGIAKAKGEWLSFVDSDDVIEPDMLEAMLNEVHQDVKVINCQMVLDVIGKSGHIESTRVLPFPFKDELLTGFRAFEYFSVLLLPVMNSTCCKLFHHSLFTEGKLSFPENHRFGEDMQVSAFAFLNSEQVVFVHKPLYHYCRRCTQLTTTFSLKKANDLIKDMEDITSLAEAAGWKKSFNAFKQEMLFSATRQTVWTKAISKLDKKTMLKKINELCPRTESDYFGIKIPLMQRIKMSAMRKGYASLLCSMLEKLSWIPGFKLLM